MLFKDKALYFFSQPHFKDNVLLFFYTTQIPLVIFNKVTLVKIYFSTLSFNTGKTAQPQVKCM